MSLRLRCPECRAQFTASDDQQGHAVACPKCGAEQVAGRMARSDPNAAPPASDPPTPSVADGGPLLPRMRPPAAPAEGQGQASPAGSVFVAKPKGAASDGSAGGPRRKRRWLPALVAFLAAAVVGGMVAWPSIRAWLDPRPKTMVEGAAYDFLHALSVNDAETLKRVSVAQDPPSIRSFGKLRRDMTRDGKSKGSFAPIGAMHRKILEKFDLDPASGRFTPKDVLGPAAETLDALHDAKAKAESSGIYDKIAGGTPEEQMQAAIDLGGAFDALSKTVLAPKKLVPSYRQLVDDARPPLPPAEKALAIDYARNRETWDALLGRPFPTLKADGPFSFEKAEIVVDVRDALASAGDPPVPLRLKLVRFRTDAIDTRWRVVSARRVVPGVVDDPEAEGGPEPEPGPSPGSSPGQSPPPRSPGESTSPSTFNSAPSPGR